MRNRCPNFFAKRNHENPKDESSKKTWFHVGLDRVPSKLRMDGYALQGLRKNLECACVAAKRVERKWGDG
jgi:hypothetical protein